MWGGQGRALQFAADDIRNNIDKYIEDFGEDKVSMMIAQLDEAATELQSSYDKTSALGKKNNKESKGLRDGKGDIVYFPDELWSQTQDGLNSANYTYDISSSGITFDGMSIGNWTKSMIDLNDSSVVAQKVPDYARTTAIAWDQYANAIPSNMDYDTMKQRVEDTLYTETTIDSSGDEIPIKDRWQLTALRQEYDNYVGQLPEGQVPITYEDYFINEGAMSDMRRQQAYSRFTDEWMDLFNKNYKDKAGAARDREAEKRRDASRIAEGIQFDTVYASDGMKQGMYAMFNNTTVPVPMAEVEASGIEGLAALNTRVPLLIEGVQKIEWGLDKDDATAKVEGVGFNNDGDLYVMYSGKLTDQGQEDYGINDDILRGLGIDPNAEADPSRSKGYASKVIKFGEEGWGNIMREVGKRKARVSEKNLIIDYYSQINNETEANFYLGVLAVAHSTNSKMLDEAVRELQSKGITKEEIELLRKRGR